MHVMVLGAAGMIGRKLVAAIVAGGLPATALTLAACKGETAEAPATEPAADAAAAPAAAAEAAPAPAAEAAPAAISGGARRALRRHRARGWLGCVPQRVAYEPALPDDQFGGRAKVLKELVEHHATESELHRAGLWADPVQVAAQIAIRATLASAMPAQVSEMRRDSLAGWVDGTVLSTPPAR